VSTPPESWSAPDTYRRGAPESGSPRAGRRVAAVAGLVAVAVVGTGAGWLLGRGGGTPAASAARGTVAASTPTASTPVSSSTTSARFADATTIGAQAAAAELKKAGLRTSGNAVEAWSWSDANGRNVLLTTKTVDKREGSVVRAATLHVYQAAGLGARPRMLLTPLRDPGTAPCEVEFNLDFVPGSIQVADRDGDGYGEATVGWWSSCRGDPGPVRLKLALLTKGGYEILRGYGLLASMELPSGITVPPATFTPNVPESRWPRGTYDPTVALFRQLFR
jgi:hypothetical protein